LSLEVFEDNNLATPGSAKLCAYQLSPNAGSINVAAGNNTLVSGIAYQHASDYPSIAVTYNGIIYDLPANVTTEMSHTRIQQTQRSISGNFTGLHTNGTFNGVISPAEHIRFLVKDTAGRLIFSFDGDMQSDGELSGNYCSVNQQAQCTGEYGLWSVAPAP